MTFNLRKVPKPLILSLGIHLVLLLLLMLLRFYPDHETQWHTFEWEQNFTKEPPLDLPGRIDPAGTADDRLPTPAAQNLPQNTQGAEQLTENIPIAEADLVEAPRFSKKEKGMQQAQTPLLNQSTSLRREFGQGSQRGIGYQSGGGGTDFEGEGVKILSRYLPEVNPSVYGTVTMEFRLNRDGRVLGESIKITNFTTSEYNKVSVSALEKWRFSFTGRFDPDKTYKVTFVYSPS